MSCVVLRTAALFATQWYGINRIPADVYSSYYWNTESIGIALRGLVVWELFRHALPSGSPLHKITARSFGIFAVGLFTFAVAAVCALWSYQNYVSFHSVYPVLDRSFGLAQTLFILAILMVVRSYRIQLGRNLWGMAIGFGIWISLSTLSTAIIDITHSFYAYLQFFRPLSFIALLATWTYALWAASPSPILIDHAVSAEEMHAWTTQWNQTQSSLRRVKSS
jgi:hypothetical protein